MPSMIETIRERLDESLGRMKGIEDLAVAESRDGLSEPEQATWDELHKQAETYAERLQVLASREEIDQRAANTLAKITRASTPEHVTTTAADAYASPGAYALDYMRMQQGDPKARSRLTRALSDVTTAETPGWCHPRSLGQWWASGCPTGLPSTATPSLRCRQWAWRCSALISPSMCWSTSRPRRRPRWPHSSSSWTCSRLT